MRSSAPFSYLVYAAVLLAAAASAAAGAWQIDAVATADATAPVPSRFDDIGSPVGLSDDDVVAIADAGGISLSDGTAVVSYGDLVSGLGRLARFSSPAINTRRDVAFLANSTAGTGTTALLLASQGAVTVVAARGAPSPDGTDFVSLGTTVDATRPAEFSLNNNGWIAFRAVTGLGSGMFLYAAGTLEKLAVIGDTAPNGAAYTSFESRDLSGNPLINRPALSDAGEAAFIATTGAGKGLFAVSRGGGGRTVAMVGDTLPGGGVLGRFSSSAESTEVGINSLGDVVFFADPANGLIGAGGVFRSSGGQLLKVVRGGDPAPTGGSFTGFGGCCYDCRLALNDNGDVAFFAWMDNSPSRGIFLSSGGVISKVATTGDAAPGGGTLTDLGLSDSGRHALSETGAVAFGGQVEGTPDAGFSIFLARAGGSLTRVARAGELAPTRPSYRSFTLGTGSINSTGTIAFQSAVAGGGIFLADGSGIRAVAAVGDPAPGGGEFTFFTPFDPPTINDAGEIAFVATFQDTGGNQRQGIFAGQPGALRPVAASGDPIARGTFGQYFPNDRAIIDNSGGVSFAATLTDGRSGVFRSLDDVLTPILRPRPPGAGGLDSNANGDVAFWGSRNAIFSLNLIAGGIRRHLFRTRSSNGSSADPLGAAAINDRRDVAFGTFAVIREGTSYRYESKIFLIDAAGTLTPVSTSEIAAGPDLNNNGEVLYLVFESETDATGLYRWLAGTADPVALEGDTTAAGTLSSFAFEEAISDAPEVAFVATATDADGAHGGLFRASP